MDNPNILKTKEEKKKKKKERVMVDLIKNKPMIDKEENNNGERNWG